MTARGAVHDPRVGGGRQVQAGGGASRRVGGLVVRGRCLSYGEGITYWPVVEMLEQLGRLAEGDAARPLRSLLGESGGAGGGGGNRLGFRKLLSRRRRPSRSSSCLDDLHGLRRRCSTWSNTSLLAENTPNRAAVPGAARAGMSGARPGGASGTRPRSCWSCWMRARRNSCSLSWAGRAERTRRVVQVAEGSPLLLRRCSRSCAILGGGEVEVPLTIQACLRRASTTRPGRAFACSSVARLRAWIFHRGAVAALAEGEGELDRRLVSRGAQGAGLPGPAAAPGRGCLPVRRPAHPGRDRRRAPEDCARGARTSAFAAWLERHGAWTWSSGRDSRRPPEQAAPVPRGARPTGRREVAGPRASGWPEPAGKRRRSRRRARRRAVA